MCIRDRGEAVPAPAEGDAASAEGVAAPAEGVAAPGEAVPAPGEAVPAPAETTPVQEPVPPSIPTEGVPPTVLPPSVEQTIPPLVTMTGVASLTEEQMTKDAKTIRIVCITSIVILILSFIGSTSYAIYNLVKPAEKLIYSKVVSSLCDEVTKTCMATLKFNINDKEYIVEKNVPYKNDSKIKKDEEVLLQYDEEDIDNTLRACCTMSLRKSRGILSAVISIIILFIIIAIIVLFRDKIF